ATSAAASPSRASRWSCWFAHRRFAARRGTPARGASERIDGSWPFDAERTAPFPSFVARRADPVPVRRRRVRAKSPAAPGEHTARRVVGARTEQLEREVEATSEIGVESLLVALDEGRGRAVAPAEELEDLHALAFALD